MVGVMVVGTPFVGLEWALWDEPRSWIGIAPREERDAWRWRKSQIAASRAVVLAVGDGPPDPSCEPVGVVRVESTRALVEGDADAWGVLSKLASELGATHVALSPGDLGQAVPSGGVIEAADAYQCRAR
jgi:hypothetical protein